MTSSTSSSARYRRARAFVAAGRRPTAASAARTRCWRPILDLLQLVDLTLRRAAASSSPTPPARRAARPTRNCRAARRPSRVATQYPRPSPAVAHRCAHRPSRWTSSRSTATSSSRPIAGVADRIVDITATGTTLRQNDLEVVDDVHGVHRALLRGARARSAPTRASSASRAPWQDQAQDKTDGPVPGGAQAPADAMAAAKPTSASVPATGAPANADAPPARPSKGVPDRGASSSSPASSSPPRPSTARARSTPQPSRRPPPSSTTSAARGDAALPPLSRTSSTACARGRADVPRQAVDAARRHGLDPEDRRTPWRTPAPTRSATSTRTPEREQSWFTARPDGALLGAKVTPLASAAVYVPGGRAPSTPPPSSWTPCLPPRPGVPRVVVRHAPPQKDGTLAAATRSPPADIAGVDGGLRRGRRPGHRRRSPTAPTPFPPVRQDRRPRQRLRRGRQDATCQRRRGHRHGRRPLRGLRARRRDASTASLVAADLMAQAEHDPLAGLLPRGAATTSRTPTRVLAAAEVERRLDEAPTRADITAASSARPAAASSSCAADRDAALARRERRWRPSTWSCTWRTR